MTVKRNVKETILFFWSQNHYSWHIHDVRSRMISIHVFIIILSVSFIYLKFFHQEHDFFVNLWWNVSHQIMKLYDRITNRSCMNKNRTFFTIIFVVLCEIRFIWNYGRWLCLFLSLSLSLSLSLCLSLLLSLSPSFFFFLSFSLSL